MLIKRFLENKNVLGEKSTKNPYKTNKKERFLYIKMIKSLIESVLMILKKPVVLLAGIVFILIDFIFRYVVEDQAIETVFSFLNFSNYPLFELQKMPFQLIASYPSELIFVGLFLIISSVISTMMSVSLANYVFEKNKSITSSIMFSVKNLMKIILLVLFFGLIFVFSAIVLWIVALFAFAAGFLGAIILLLVIVFMGFVLLHFVFVPALIGKGLNIKKAFKESWNFSGKNFFSVILLLIGIALIDFVLSQIYIIILNTDFGENELMIIVEMIFTLIILTYTNIVFPLFYLNKSK
ncbi:MAG: hypothetical protein COT90_00700 [Candidatus Diapherotrites archaeon CG10_big_fil_rev_8_21_14_0_10_31_34]|nr:MAG: hypothetical protein COT90_00700 [Candidatus Diapherotrites archaeon CG10_big_fil_rev_8_21_14_0_10_31_34]